MTDLRDFVTESEAARMVGVSAGKGVVWRHLASHAPHIKQEEIFGFTAVRRDQLEAYCASPNRKKVVDAFTRQKRRAMLRRLQAKVANR